MSNVAFALRWIGGLVVAVVTYLAVIAAGAQIWKHFPADVEKIFSTSMMFATTLAMIAAAHVVARESWKAMSWMVLLLATMFPLAVVHFADSPGTRMMGLLLFGKVLVGGLIGFLVLSRTLRFGRVPEPPGSAGPPLSGTQRAHPAQDRGTALGQ
jgi:hypothetical protein